MNNTPPPEFDTYADSYEADLKSSLPSGLYEDKYFAEYKIQFMANRLHDSSPARILDFGCGIGRSLGLLQERYPLSDVCGFDVSEASLKFARNTLSRLQLTSDLEDFQPSSFNVIFTANVFHHIPPNERLQALTKCKYLLKEGGSIFLFEHNPFNPLTRLVFERCVFDKDAEMLRKSEVFDMAKAIGLRVKRADYTLFFPKQLAFFRPSEKLLSWLPLGAQYCVEMEK